MTCGKLIKIVEFQIVDHMISVSDPHYLGTGHYKSFSVENGVWKLYVIQTERDEELLGKRVAAVICVRESIHNLQKMMKELYDIFYSEIESDSFKRRWRRDSIIVHTGYVGFVWNSQNSDQMTIEETVDDTIDIWMEEPGMLVSETGFGDGVYNIYLCKSDCDQDNGFDFLYLDFWDDPLEII